MTSLNKNTKYGMHLIRRSKEYAQRRELYKKGKLGKVRKDGRSV
jgi:hypothetical protein